MTTFAVSPAVSLLWPDSTARATFFSLPSSTFHDLELDETINGFDPDSRLRHDTRAVLGEPVQDVEVLLFRQAVIKDLIENRSILTMFETILPNIELIEQYQRSVDRQRTPLQELAWRASELESLVDIVGALVSGLDPQSTTYSAGALIQLYEAAASTAADPTFQQLESVLPELLSQLRSTTSVTIGVNLDRQQRPIEAVLLSVNTEKFEDAGFLNRMLGRDEKINGIAPLHRVPQNFNDIPSNSEFGRRGINPLMVPLFRDLAEVMQKTVDPIARALRQFGGLNSRFLTRLRPEIGFYVAAVRLYDKLHTLNLPVCFPEIAPSKDRVCYIEAAYNLNLIRHLTAAAPGLPLDDQVVLNDCFIGDEWGRILVLTGPNRGGKTTYTQMVGLIQVMAQAGLFVPARRARISPADGIFTHFPAEEKLGRGTGRFGDEARRLADILSQATRQSFILLNESLTGTTPGESLYLARDIVKIFSQIGLRAIFNTHLHELGENLVDLNRESQGDSKVVSVIASRIGPDDGKRGKHQRSYEVKPGPPMGRSYALEIAADYGLDFAQLQKKLIERGVLVEPEEDSSDD